MLKVKRVRNEDAQMSTAQQTAIAAALANYTDAQLLNYSDTAATNQLIADALLTVTLSNGQSWTGRPTFNLVKGANILRNLSVAGALTATFQNLDDTILIESDSRGGPRRAESLPVPDGGPGAGAHRRRAGALLGPSGGLQLCGGRAVELPDQQPGELGHLLGPQLLRQQQPGRLQDHNGPAKLLHAGRNALLHLRGSPDLRGQRAPLLLPARGDDGVAGAGFLDQTAGDARYLVRAPSAESGQIFNLVQEQFTPRIVRNLLLEAPLVGDAILGNQSTLRIRSDSWSKAEAEADSRFLRTNHRRAPLGFSTSSKRSSADLHIRNATTTIRAEDGTLLASFAGGGIGLEQDVTVRSDRTLNATTADFAQFFVGSTAATGTFSSSSSVTVTQEIESDLRVQAPLVRCDPAASVLTIHNGSHVDDTLRVNGALAPEASLPFLSLSGGSSGVQVLSPLLEQIAVGASGETVGMVIRNASPTGAASLLLDSNNQNGVAELVVLSGGGVQINSFQQCISFNNTSGLANMAIEPNIGGSNDEEVIFGYGFVNLSDRALKENVRAIPGTRSSSRPSTRWSRSSTTASTGARSRSASWPRTWRPAGSWGRRCARRRLWTGGS